MPQLLSDLMSGTAVSYLDLNAGVRAGLPASALREFIDQGWLTWAEAESVLGNRRTLSRRLKADAKLTQDESDRLATLAGVFGHAIRVFGDPEKAKRWMRRPHPRFDGQSGLDLVATVSGVGAVTEALGQIDHGMIY